MALKGDVDARINDRFDLEPDVNEKVMGSFSSGKRQVQKWLGKAYEPLSDEQHEGYDDLVNAIALVTFAESLKTTNLRITERGGVVTSTGFDASRQELMSQGQLESLQGKYVSEALSLISHWKAEVPVWHA